MSVPDHRLDWEDHRCFGCALQELRDAIYSVFPEEMAYVKVVRYVESWAEEARDDLWEAGKPWRACSKHGEEGSY